MRLGEPVATAVDAGLLEPTENVIGFGLLLRSSCDRWAATDGSHATVLTDHEGTVVAVSTGHPGWTGGPAAPGQPLAEVADTLGVPAPDPVSDLDDSSGGVLLDAPTGPGTYVQVLGRPEMLPLETVDVVLRDQLRADGVTVYLADDEGELRC